ncbi:MAG: hypothetical protein UY78_C0007G0020 [Parcubacteria group bacterium GW2011_GWA1_53_13]|nr:MAG: hypothetical protein UT56_C0019G0005 [Candidatus Levybacteria bacterium GW2011_GWB1_39_7]KKW07376.1 MAG: hypothetical protein UY42_C0013G0010 [Parcubacteria group bacterium GW2011_GWA2_49_16]KKW33604.1 MAG: hypothetical protein UY78_C0007G0020 [Parcubacteria group bacterium GW2011_GWA1_53_13]
MRERLQKRSKIYGSLFFVFWVFLYFAQNFKVEMMKIAPSVGGFDSYTAFFIVALQPLFGLAVLFCGVMWLIVRSKIKKLPQ